MMFVKRDECFALLLRDTRYYLMLSRHLEILVEIMSGLEMSDLLKVYLLNLTEIEENYSECVNKVTRTQTAPSTCVVACVLVLILFSCSKDTFLVSMEG